MRLKSWVIVVGIVIVLSISFFLSENMIIVPKVSVSSMKIQIGGLVNSSLVVTLKIYNPNPTPITITGIEYALYCDDGVMISKENITKSIVIPGESVEYLDLVVKMRYGTLKAIWGELEATDRINWYLKGKLYAKLEDKNITISFNWRN